MIYIAANENYKNIDYVIKSNALEFLTFVNFYIRKQQLEASRIRNSQRR